MNGKIALKVKSLAAATGVALAMTGGSAGAAVLYGTSGAGGAGSNLYTINTTTGATTLIGAVGYTVNGLESYGGVLYATTSGSSGGFGSGRLIQIDKTTGAGTAIGPAWNTTGVPSNMTELAINSSGQAFSWGEPWEDDLYRINLGSGVATRVGESALGTAVHGLAFDSAGNLHMINCAFCTSAVIDTSTGASSSLTTYAFYAHHADTDPTTSLIWGLDAYSGTASASTSINIVDISAGTVIGTLQLDRGLHTLAFDSVPEPGTLALLGLGLAGLAAARRRKQ